MDLRLVAGQRPEAIRSYGEAAEDEPGQPAKDLRMRRAC